MGRARGNTAWTGRARPRSSPGGVSGIGFGIARAFCAAGIDLVLSYRNEDYRARAEAWFAANDRPMPRFVELDVTDRARWAHVADGVGAGPHSGQQRRCQRVRPDRRSELRRLRLDHGRELRRRGERPRDLRPAHQGAGTGRARRERGVDGGLPVGAAGRHLHGEQVRRARPDRVPALQPGAVRDRRVADVPRADADQCLGLGVEAPGGVRSLGLRRRPIAPSSSGSAPRSRPAWTRSKSARRCSPG